jgi:hypothetical protein
MLKLKFYDAEETLLRVLTKDELPKGVTITVTAYLEGFLNLSIPKYLIPPETHHAVVYYNDELVGSALRVGITSPY